MDTFNGFTRFWIGLNDIYNETVFTWATNTNQSYPIYRDWGIAEPNGATNENCGDIIEYNGLWKMNDESCSHEILYYCDMPIYRHGNKVGGGLRIASGKERLNSINTWAIDTGLNGVMIKDWNVDDIDRYKSDNITIQQQRTMVLGSGTSTVNCAPFNLSDDEYINAHKTFLYDHGTQYFVSGIMLRTNLGNVFNCSDDSLFSWYDEDSGWIEYDNHYLSGFYLFSGYVIDGIGYIMNELPFPKVQYCIPGSIDNNTILCNGTDWLAKNVFIGNLLITEIYDISFNIELKSFPGILEKFILNCGPTNSIDYRYPGIAIRGNNYYGLSLTVYFSQQTPGMDECITNFPSILLNKIYTIKIIIRYKSIEIDINNNLKICSNKISHLYKIHKLESCYLTPNTNIPDALITDFKLQSFTPTSNPTQYPTNIPTKHPTIIPSNNPTNIPSQNPTNTPTMHPTTIPTKNPTMKPTQTPTHIPSKHPTKVPTKNPTYISTILKTTSLKLTPNISSYMSQIHQLKTINIVLIITTIVIIILVICVNIVCCVLYRKMLLKQFQSKYMLKTEVNSNMNSSNNENSSKMEMHQIQNFGIPSTVVNFEEKNDMASIMQNELPNDENMDTPGNDGLTTLNGEKNMSRSTNAVVPDDSSEEMYTGVDGDEETNFGDDVIVIK